MGAKMEPARPDTVPAAHMQARQDSDCGSLPVVLLADRVLAQGQVLEPAQLREGQDAGCCADAVAVEGQELQTWQLHQCICAGDPVVAAHQLGEGLQCCELLCADQSVV